VMSRRRYDGSWLFVRSSSVYLFHGSFVWVQIVLASSTFQPELSVREGLTEKSLKFLSYDVVAFQAMAMYFVGCVGGLWTETDEHRAHREQRLDEAEQRVEGTRALVVTIMSWESSTHAQEMFGNSSCYISVLVCLCCCSWCVECLFHSLASMAGFLDGNQLVFSAIARALRMHRAVVCRLECDARRA